MGGLIVTQTEVVPAKVCIHYWVIETWPEDGVYHSVCDSCKQTKDWPAAVSTHTTVWDTKARGIRLYRRGVRHKRSSVLSDLEDAESAVPLVPEFFQAEVKLVEDENE